MVSAAFSPDRALAALLEALDEGAFFFDEAHVCRAAGRRAAELLGAEVPSLVGAARSALVQRFADGCEDPSAVVAALGGDALSEASTAVDPINVLRPHARTVVWTSVPLLDAGYPVGRVDVLRDVTRERHAEASSEILSKKLEEISTIDDATGLVNRRSFERDVDREHRRCQRAWVPYAVVRLRVEGFASAKEHGRAEELLRIIGEELRVARREYDVVARWDEAEIAMLLPGADAKAAKTISKRCASAAADRAKAKGELGVLTIGAAVWIPPSGDGALEMLQRAGEALEVARARGPGEVHLDAGFGAWKDDLAGS